MSVIAIDIGFGFTKATNGQKNLIYKSVYGDATELQFREQFLDKKEQDQYLHIELDSKSYFVGELAEMQSMDRRFTLDPQQFVSNFTKVLALPAMARLAGPKASVSLVVGLPISHYRRHKDELSTLLTGQHRFNIIEATGEKTEANIRVREVKVIPQPFGTVLDLMLSQKGEITDRKYAQEKIGVIDVGFRTTDFTIADQGRYSERGSRSIDYGISKAFSGIAARLQEIAGINVELYRLFEATERGWIKIHGKRYDINPVREHAYTELASTIASQVNQLWANDWDIDQVVVSGGGGATLLPYMQKQLKGKVVPIDPAQDTRFNNVKGYYKYGARLWLKAPIKNESATKNAA